MDEIYALDIETTGLDWHVDRILCIGIWNPTTRLAFDSVSLFREWLSLRDTNTKFITHSGAFDVNFLRHNGIDISDHWAYDTRSIASILIPQPRQAEGQKTVLGLENLSITLLNGQSYKLDRNRLSEYSKDDVRNYCLKDCELTYKLFDYLLNHINQKSWTFVESWLMPATRFCADLEWNGVCIDDVGLKKYQLEIQNKRDLVHVELNEMAKEALRFFHEKQVSDVKKTYREMYEKAKVKTKDQDKCANRYQTLESNAIGKIAAFNWNSSTQLQWLLRDFYCLDIFNRREDKETTNEAMLKTLDHPVAKKLVDYRELEKLCSTCIPALLENLSENKVIHANYTVGGTRTGRLSSSTPNLQQIPKGPIRSYVRSSCNVTTLLTIDYAQIEVRILAELAKEEELINAFKEKIDPYSIIAQKLLQIDCPVREIKEKFKRERDVSKTAGLSILYGTGAAKLQEVLKKELNKSLSLQDCKKFIDNYRAGFPGITSLRKQLERNLANQKTVYNLLGRSFYIESNDDIYMKGLNTLVQGSASDLVIFSQTASVIPKLKKLDVDFKHRLLIHDEVVIELREDEAQVLTDEVIIPAMTLELQSLLNLTVPLAVEYNISKTWCKP